MVKIEFPENVLSVYAGSQSTIKPKLVAINEGGKVPTDPQYIWESSDPEVAEIKNGKLRAIKSGSAIITCKLKTDESVSSLVFINVIEPVKTLELNTDTQSIQL